MAEKQSNNFVYESSLHKILMEEYSRLSTDNEYIDWGKKAQMVAAHMSDALSRVSMAMAFEKRRLEKDCDPNVQTKIKMGLMQYEGFRQIVQTQLDDLIKVMGNLPTGSVKPIVKEMDKSKIPTANSPYVKVFVRKSGEIILNGELISIDALNNELASLAQQNGVVLYTRESPEEPEPPAIAKSVIDLVIKNHLPIRLCMYDDFSDAVDADGKLRIEN